MGKTTNLNDVVKGKVGNLIGSYNSNTDSRLKQIVRAYTSKVANPNNPRTFAQANQRAKLLPINLHYRAFRDLIDRGFEGIRYGQMSRNKYLSIVLNGNTPVTDLAPVRKGTLLYEPSQLPISMGSLPEITPDFLFFPDEMDEPVELPDGTSAYFSPGAAVKQLPTYTEGSQPQDTIAAFSTAMIAAGLAKNGDQFTYCAVRAKNDDPDTYYPEFNSFIIDDSNNAGFPQQGKIRFGLKRNIYGSVENFGTYQYGVYSKNADPNDPEYTNGYADYILAACFAISREADTPKRSTATLTLAPVMASYETYTTQNWNSYVVPSYMTSGSSKTTDWPLDGTEIAATEVVMPEGAVSPIQISIAGHIYDSENGATATNVRPPYAMGWRMSNGKIKIAATDEGEDGGNVVGIYGADIIFDYPPIGQYASQENVPLFLSNLDTLNIDDYDGYIAWDRTYTHY